MYSAEFDPKEINGIANLLAMSHLVGTPPLPWSSLIRTLYLVVNHSIGIKRR